MNQEKVNDLVNSFNKQVGYMQQQLRSGNYAELVNSAKLFGTIIQIRVDNLNGKE